MADIVEQVLNPKNSKSELMDIYSDWATSYDAVMESRNFTGPKMASQVFESVVTDKGARILDIGAGTGTLGACLKEAGYSHIDALDPNEAMLDEARKLNVYKHFIVDFLANNQLNVENDTYDAVIGSGVFSPGHINEACFGELCRITKPGGRLVLISSELYLEEKYDGYGQRLAAAIQECQSRGLWRIEKQESVHYFGPYMASISYLVIQ